MKSTTVFALVASLLPLSMAAPLNIAERDAEADVKYEVDYVTDVEVATVFTQVTQYWTGEPAAETPSPATTSSAPAMKTSVPAHNRHHDGEGRGRRSTVEYTIQQTPTPEPAPTSTSTVVAPPPPPAPTSTSTTQPPPPAPTTFITVVPQPPAPATTSTTSTSTSSTQEAPPSTNTNQYGKNMGPADYTADPNFAPMTTSRADKLSSDDFKAASVQAANAWRAKWGASPVEWDDSMAAIAQKSVDSGCGPNHTGAQNFAWGTAMSPAGAFSQWGGESSGWQQSSRDGENAPTEIGHFTQLVWKDATKMGCAVRDCSAGGKYDPWIFVACNWNTGNGGETANYVDSLPSY